MIEVKNLSGQQKHVNSLKKIGETVLRKERKDHLDLSVVLLKEPKMRALNRVYRGKDESTNVLSFSGGSFALGEVFLCPSVISKEAKKYGMIYRTALAYMLIHGILHLAGYEHKKNAKRMEARERHYLSLF